MGSKILNIAILLIVVLLLQPFTGLADQWPAPKPQHVVSTNGTYLVRIVPGESWGDTFGFTGSKKGAYARGEFYKKQADRSFTLMADAPLQNPVAPVHLLLSDQGYLVTFDNWHNAGYGKAVAIYKPNGALLRSYEVEELYPAKRVEEVPQSVSSRHWLSNNHGFYPGSDERMVYAYDFRGGLFLFALPTGNFEYLEGGQQQLLETMKP
ncbi:MAG: hypothetical protein A4C66_01790 [Nitrospira sp. HN-bin3]|uniref:hypothetical protein n=1 Tax=Nitrospira cf. moscoviensis SBR1015 TaxID=96242 RepID=UPI000A09D44C|nr:hypothetical protein [Nitrospira cf. moscoviensis SBR1015]OQW44881.1 MAG: hypothetical protein A4C66_01790 [Nitrospira sp. HN-bin3]